MSWAGSDRSRWRVAPDRKVLLCRKNLYQIVRHVRMSVLHPSPSGTILPLPVRIAFTPHFSAWGWLVSFHTTGRYAFDILVGGRIRRFDETMSTDMIYTLANEFQIPSMSDGRAYNLLSSISVRLTRDEYHSWRHPWGDTMGRLPTGTVSACPRPTVTTSVCTATAPPPSSLRARRIRRSANALVQSRRPPVARRHQFTLVPWRRSTTPCPSTTPRTGTTDPAMAYSLHTIGGDLREIQRATNLGVWDEETVLCSPSRRTTSSGACARRAHEHDLR